MSFLHPPARQLASGFQLTTSQWGFRPPPMFRKVPPPFQRLASLCLRPSFCSSCSCWSKSSMRPSPSQNSWGFKFNCLAPQVLLVLKHLLQLQGVMMTLILFAFLKLELSIKQPDTSRMLLCRSLSVWRTVSAISIASTLTFLMQTKIKSIRNKSTHYAAEWPVIVILSCHIKHYLIIFTVTLQLMLQLVGVDYFG